MNAANLMRDRTGAEVSPQCVEDRRQLTHIPERGFDRRREKKTEWDDSDIRDGLDLTARYRADTSVRVYERRSASSFCLESATVNISRSGLLLGPLDAEDAEEIQEGGHYYLRFELVPGQLPEGYESHVHIGATVTRLIAEGEERFAALQFDQKLSRYLAKKRWNFFEMGSLLLLAFALVCIVWLKRLSLFYFVFDVPLFLYGMFASVFLVTRFLFAAFYKNIEPLRKRKRRAKIDSPDFRYDFTPGVSIVIPCFNEEKWIVKTIRSCLDQYYPEEKLEVIVVDDGSSDNSAARIQELCESLKPEVGDRLTFLQQKQNLGKRHAMAAGFHKARNEVLVCVDSDSFLTSRAVLNLVQPLKDPKVGAVSGRTEVENKWTNYLTKMQAVRYYIAFRIFKASEGLFDTVTCLSGPLACYRRTLVMQCLDDWLHQTFLGYPATFGDDRSLTNFILKNHRTQYQDKAVCYTIVPSTMKQFLRQQMRWKRSWLRESMRAASFMWLKEPFAALSFYGGLVLPILAPLIVLRALVYMPIVHGIWPLTFLFGIFLMSLLMSASYLLLKRSSLWVYGAVFCAFYLTVLLWQMLPAMLTFWKSEWGTRETIKDLRGLKATP